jgi:5,6,7,8-tetrahydromethanopterin hydro-lyase
MLIGESFIGEGAHVAHVNTVLGHRDGPVGTAWATALATPAPGTLRSSWCCGPACRSSR